MIYKAKKEEEKGMATFYVNWKELDTKAAELEGLNKSLINECATYEQNANALKSSFEGDVADDFFREAQDHKAKMTMFTDVITKYVEAMRQMAANAQQKEVAAQNVVSQKNY